MTFAMMKLFLNSTITGWFLFHPGSLLNLLKNETWFELHLWKLQF
jgi:hypothetical protein